nr:hypothetical protein CFP56_65605 [Quercus suber]
MALWQYYSGLTTVPNTTPNNIASINKNLGDKDIENEITFPLGGPSLQPQQLLSLLQFQQQQHQSQLPQVAAGHAP